MAVQSDTYNSRVTDESLEKKFRDTFKSQSGAALVNDLYASGTIVPIVDFTAAAQGSELRSDLQKAWDFATGNDLCTNTTTTFVSTPGFYKVGLTLTIQDPSSAVFGRVYIEDGAATEKVIWKYSVHASTATGAVAVAPPEFTVFLRSGDSLKAQTDSGLVKIELWYRQIADVSGNLVNPLGFTSS